MTYLNTVPAIGILLTWTCLATAVPSDREAPEREIGPVALQLRAENPEIEVGQNPKIQITLAYQGDKPATFVQPGDGSCCSWRTPIIGWSVIGADEGGKHPKKPPQFTGARCGNINPLTNAEIIHLKRGERVKLNEWVGQPSLASPGTYRVLFYYSNQPNLEWEGLPLGDHDPATMKAVKASTSCDLISNEITITVKPKGDK